MGRVIVFILVVCLIVGGIRSCIENREAYRDCFQSAKARAFDKHREIGDQFYFESTKKLTRAGWILTGLTVLLVVGGGLALRGFGQEIIERNMCWLRKVSLISYLNRNIDQTDIGYNSLTSDEVENEVDKFNLHCYEQGEIKYKELSAGFGMNCQKLRSEFSTRFREVHENLSRKIKWCKASDIAKGAKQALIFLITFAFSSCGSTRKACSRGSDAGKARGEWLGYWRGTFDYIGSHILEGILWSAACLIGVLLLILLAETIYGFVNAWLYQIRAKAYHKKSLKDISELSDREVFENLTHARVTHRRIEKAWMELTPLVKEARSSEWGDDYDVIQYIAEARILRSRYKKNTAELGRAFLTDALNLAYNTQIDPEWKLEAMEEIMSQNLND